MFKYVIIALLMVGQVKAQTPITYRDSIMWFQGFKAGLMYPVPKYYFDERFAKPIVPQPPIWRKDTIK